MSKPKSIRIPLICEVCSIRFYHGHKGREYGSIRFCSMGCRNRSRIKPLRERFLKYIGTTTETGCILWIGRVNARGYGCISKGPGFNDVLAHRISYEFRHGSFPEEMNVLHHCDNPTCINPDHLFLGTQADNMADKQAKGRTPTGEKTGHAKLSDEKVREIRERYTAGGITQYQLATEFRVNQSAIHKVIMRKNWKHI